MTVRTTHGNSAQLESCAAFDGIHQLLFQNLSRLENGQLEQVHAGASCRQPLLHFARTVHTEPGIQLRKAEQGWSTTRRHKLDESVPFLVIHIADDLPEERDRRVSLGESTRVHSVSSEVADVDRCLGSRDERLDLIRGEHKEPLTIDHVEQAVAERSALRPNLQSHDSRQDVRIWDRAQT